ncbi:hypothetical protein [Methylobacterium sp. 17Sr1-1]|uniref:hypothetical protein n=1 Tax=Methylobacterium sp. 17Sr1-1 TaxID=2202826 RepID=UPI0013A58C80|nr:hypothetical protein [Methylobacterium sp. 17Sr1-1]
MRCTKDPSRRRPTGDTDSIDWTTPAQRVAWPDHGPGEPVTTTLREPVAASRAVEAGSA